MGDQTYNDLVAAVETVMGYGNVTDAERHNAQAFIEGFKESFVDTIPYLMPLADLNNSPVVRHFAYHVLEHVVKFGWNTFSPEQRDELKNQLVPQIIMNGSHPLTKEEKFVKERISAAVVEMVKREYPQEWPTLLPDLIGLGQEGATQAELALLIIRSMAEHAGDSPDPRVNSKRSRDILDGISGSLADLMPFLFQFLVDQYTIYREAGGEAGGSEDAYAASLLLNALLELLEMLLDWVPLQALFQTEIMSVLHALLPDQKFRGAAVVCLTVAATRKWAKPEEKETFLSVLGSLDEIKQGFLEADGTPEDIHAFHKRLAVYLTRICQMQYSLLNIRNAVVHDNFEEALSVLMAITNHESLALSSIPLQFWINFCKGGVDRETANDNSMVMELLQVCQQRSIKPDYKAGDVYTALDFDSETDFQSEVSISRGRLGHLLRSLVDLAPGLSFQLASDFVTSVMEQLGDMMAADGHPITAESSSYRTLEAASGTAETILRCISDEAFSQNSAMVEAMVAMVDGMIATDIGGMPGQVMTRFLHLFVAFMPFFKRFPDQLGAVMERLFAFVLFRDAGDANRDLSDLSLDSLAPRRKACTCIARLCVDLAPQLLPMLGTLYETVKGMVDGDVLTPDQHAMLMEAMLGVSAAQDPNDHAQFVASVLEPLVAEWTGTMISSTVGDPGAFLTCMGLAGNDAIRDGTDPAGWFHDDHRMYRARLRFLVNSFYCVIKRMVEVKDAAAKENAMAMLASHWESILPNVFGLVATLHSLWTTQVANQIAQPMIGILTIPLDAFGYAGAGTGAGVPSRDEEVPAERAVRAVRSFLAVSREYLYSIAGWAAEGGFLFSFDAAVEMTSDSLLSNLNAMHDRHLARLIHNFISRSFAAVDESSFDRMSGLLAAVLTFLRDRLEAGWDERRRREAGQTTLTELEEVVQERMLRDLTREVVTLITQVVPQNLDEADAAVQWRAQAILFTEETALAFMATACSLLGFADTYTLRRAIHVCQRLLPLVVAEGAYQTLIGQNMLTAALQALTETEDHEDKAHFVSLIRDIYVSVGEYDISVVRNVLLGLPEVTEDSVVQLEDRLGATNSRTKQRQSFRKWLERVVDSSITSTLFSRDAIIIDLPPSPLASQSMNADASDPASFNLTGVFGER